MTPIAARSLLALLPALATPATAQLAPDPATDVERLAEACNRFGERLYGQIAADGNPTCAPGSIAAALHMLLVGARGETATELADALALPADLRGERLLRASAALLPKGDGALRVRNDLWVQDGYQIVPEYPALLERTLGAGTRHVDFGGATERAREVINAYVAKATEQRIEELLQPGDLDPRTRAVLTNTMWFQGAWLHPFHADATQPAPFTLQNGDEVEAPMMHLTKPLPYAEHDAWQCVGMTFDGSPIRFEAIVPTGEGTIAQARDALLRGEHLASLRARNVALAMPRFRVKARHDLPPALEALGVEKAFVHGEADFSGIETKRELAVEKVIHEAWISVDEKGCEAAAATAVVLKLRGMPAAPKHVSFDRPFVFGLRDTRTGLLWFVGRVDDPSAQS